MHRHTIENPFNRWASEGPCKQDCREVDWLGRVIQHQLPLSDGRTVVLRVALGRAEDSVLGSMLLAFHGEAGLAQDDILDRVLLGNPVELLDTGDMVHEPLWWQLWWSQQAVASDTFYTSSSMNRWSTEWEWRQTPRRWWPLERQRSQNWDQVPNHHRSVNATSKFLPSWVDMSCFACYT